MQVRGLVPMHCPKWEAAAYTLTVARHVIATQSLFADVTLVPVDASTPDHLPATMAQMVLGCGVLPLAG